MLEALGFRASFELRAEGREEAREPDTPRPRKSR